MNVRRFLELTGHARRFSFGAGDGYRPNVGELGILACLCAWGWPKCRQKVLVKAQGLSGPTVSYRLQRLCSMGYLMREGLPEDPSVVIFTPTKKAKVVSILLARRSATKGERDRGISGYERLFELAAECAAACSVVLPSERICLLALGAGRDMVVSEVSGLTGLTFDQASNGLKGLVRSGCVARKRLVGSDGRRFSYGLTEKGAQALADVVGEVAHVSPSRILSLVEEANECA